MIQPGQKRTWRRKLAFSALLTLGFFALSEAGLALYGLQPLLVRADPYVGFSAQVPLLVEEKRGHQVWLRTAPNKRQFFNALEFPKDKAAGEFRVFCVGGSTTYGRPYDQRTAYCAWLEAMLRQLDPQRPWRVINAGGISYASYRISTLMQELARYSPDLFIVYTGHNEFLEERTYRDLIELPEWLTAANAVLARTRVYTLLKSAVDGLRPAPYTLPPEVDDRLHATVGPESYHRDDRLHRQVLAHYRVNLERIEAVARAAGSKVVFVTPAANLKDLSPFKSQLSAVLGDAERAGWARSFGRGKDLLAAGDPASALSELTAATRIDDRHAELQFLRGRALLALERTSEARAALQRAVDEDVAPLRMPSALRAALREFCARRQVPLLDFERLLEQRLLEAGRPPIPGQEWFLDHVHPTPAGHRELALALLELLRAQSVIDARRELTREDLDAIGRRIMAAITPDRERVAMRNLARVMGWAGKLEEAHRTLLGVHERFGADAETLAMLGHSADRLGRPEDAIEYHVQAVAVAPDRDDLRMQLAQLFVQRGRIERAIEEYRASIERAPALQENRHALAELLVQTGHTDAAMTEYRLLLERFPDDAVAAVNLGTLALWQGDLGAARSAFTPACERRDALAKACVGLAEIAETRGQWPDAAYWYRQAMRAEPRNANLHNNLAIVLLQLGEIDAAIEHFGLAVDIDPQFGQARQNLATALAERRAAGGGSDRR